MIISFSLLFTIFLGLNFYIFKKYKIAPVAIQKISLECNLRASDLLLYVTEKSGFGTDFSKAFHPLAKHDTLIFDLNDMQIRTFRLYIGICADSIIIKNVKVFYKDKTEMLTIDNLSSDGIYNKNLDNSFLLNFSSNVNGYFELKRAHISAFEFMISEFIAAFLSVIFSLLCLSILKRFTFTFPSLNKIKILSVLFFLASIFLPHPIFNVFFILSLVLVISDFNYNVFFASKASVFFVLYFCLFFIINFFYRPTFNGGVAETLIPVFLLPIYFACIPKFDYLKVFPIISFFLSIWFFSSSSIDTLIYMNVNYFSFDAFTKYLHPVYFSYLLLFSLIYLELVEDKILNKNILRITFLISLLFCGSKLIISLTILFYGYRFLRKKIVLGFAVLIILIAFVLSFPPTKKRFGDIINFSNITILADHPLKSIHDERLNGLTLRLIIWQESLSSISSINELFFGKGVEKDADLFLERRLANRGLEVGQTKYDPHNQFIATLYKFGLVGDILILLICYNLFYIGFRQSNYLLIYAVSLFFIVMLTESILQRIVGINFYISILLLLSIPSIYPSKDFENSNHRN